METIVQEGKPVWVLKTWWEKTIYVLSAIYTFILICFFVVGMFSGLVST